MLYCQFQSGESGSDSLPMYMRIVTRGAVAEIRSDVSSLELFLVGVHYENTPMRFFKL